MTRAEKIGILGPVYSDLLLSPQNSHLRLGGICHCIRGASALNTPVLAAYYHPKHLGRHIEAFLKNHKLEGIPLGEIEDCPNLVIIEDPKEVGQQGYEIPFEAHTTCTTQKETVRQIIEDPSITDLLLIPADYCLDELLEIAKSSDKKIHVDVVGKNWTTEKILSIKNLKTLFISTSSDFFLNNLSGNPKETINQLRNSADFSIVLKENRGGSRLFSPPDLPEIMIGAQTVDSVHSVGVGDCFDMTAIVLSMTHGLEAALRISTWIAAEYARTLDFSAFSQAVNRILKIPDVELFAFKGICVPWEKRSDVSIYLAAPDFSYVRKPNIDDIASALSYHNFRVRRPIVENGEILATANKSTRKITALADWSLLEECQILVAVLEFLDPGTLIEIGMALQKGIPAIVYDPHSLADNLMLTELPCCVTNDRNTIIRSVFEKASKSIK